MTRRQLRTLRAAAASATATLLAAVSHTIGGGAPPHPLLVIAMAVLLVPLSALLVGARPRRIRVAGTVLVAQGAFHLVFQTLGAGMSTTGVAAGHHHLDLALLGPVAPAAALDAGMLGAHIVAAALTALVIWHGEQLLRRVIAWVQVMLRLVLPMLRPHHSAPAPLRSAMLRIRLAPWASAVSRRGPPVFSCG